MARSQKVKSKDLSIHSRAARRATSPSINVDKSILNADRVEEGRKELHDVYSQSPAGISKRKRAKPMTRQQRLRQEKGMEKAAQNLDKMSKKVADSHFREKKVKTRNVPWEALNDDARATTQHESSVTDKQTSTAATNIVRKIDGEQESDGAEAPSDSEVDEVL